MENELNKEFEESVLSIRRVSKKTSGGNYVTFSALVAVGNRNGKVGIGLGKSIEVPLAIKKATARALKNLIEVPIVNGSIPFEITYKYKAAKIILKPAPLGAGLKVGSVIRTILSLAGIQNATGKIIKSRDKIANAYATINSLKKLQIAK